MSIPGAKTALLTNGTVCFLDNSHVKVPKIGLLRVAGSQARLLKRICETRIGTVTLTKDSADRFFLSMQLASDESFVKVSKATHGHVGIDLNTDNFLTDSEGNIVPNPRYYRTIKGKLAKEQRILSRRQQRAKKEHRSLRDSKNYQKQRLLVAKLHAKVMNQRHNFLQQISTALIKNHDLVVAEELRSKNLLKIMLWHLVFLTLAGEHFLACWLIKQSFMGVNLSQSTQEILPKHVAIVAL